jgi:hypothetical protein
MAPLFDIIGSMVVRGAILLMVLNLSVQMNNAVYQKAAFTATRQSTAVPTQLLYDDLTLAGYGQGASKIFSKAKSDEVEFYADQNNDGVNETIHYYLAGESAPGMKMLYRSVTSINNGNPQMIARNVARLTFEYLDIDGNSATRTSTTNVAGIKSIRFKLSVQTDEKSRLAFWEKIVFPSNL